MVRARARIASASGGAAKSAKRSRSNAARRCSSSTMPSLMAQPGVLSQVDRRRGCRGWPIIWRPPSRGLAPVVALCRRTTPLCGDGSNWSTLPPPAGARVGRGDGAAPGDSRSRSSIGTRGFGARRRRDFRKTCTVTSSNGCCWDRLWTVSTQASNPYRLFAWGKPKHAADGVRHRRR